MLLAADLERRHHGRLARRGGGEFSRELAGLIAGAQLVVIPGAGHQPFQALPEEYNRLLEDFWATVG